MQKIFREFFPRKKLMMTFFCYFAVALLSVFLNMFGYVTALNTLEEEISKNSQSTVEKLRIIGDGYLSEVRQVAYSVLSSDAAGRLSRDNLTQTQKEIYISMLLRDVVSNRTEGEFGALILNKDMYIQNNIGMCSLSVAWKSFFRDYESAESWITDMTAVPGIRCNVVTDSSGKQTLRIIYYVPRMREDVAVIATADSAHLRQLISLDAADGEYVYLAGDNRIIMQSHENSPVPGNIEAVLNNDKIRIDGKIYIINRVQSEFDNMTYVKLTDYENLANPIKKVQRRFVLSFILCLLIGAVISYFLSKINLIKELKYMNETKEYRRHIEAEALKRLLAGRQSPGDSEYLNNISQRLAYGNYVLAAFDFFEKVNGDIGEFDKSYRDRLSSFIESKLTASMANINIEKSCVDDTVVIIIAAETVDTNKLKECVESISAKMYEEFNVEMCCAISDFSSEFMNLNIQYSHCMEALSASFFEDAGVLVYDRNAEDRSEVAYSLSTEEQLIRLIKEGDVSGANNLINSVLSSGNGRSIEVGKLLLSEIICTLIKTGEELYSSGSPEMDKMYKDLADYCSTSLYYRLRGNISSYVRTLCSYAVSVSNLEEETTGEKRCGKIREYIETNYSDVNLNVNTVADTFKVSRSWLSTNFKKDYGVNISDFIVTCRINKAKELLATDMSVNDIAVNVGFTNKTVYCRAFKRYENITSGQYRELLRKKEI